MLVKYDVAYGVLLLVFCLGLNNRDSKNKLWSYNSFQNQWSMSTGVSAQWMGNITIPFVDECQRIDMLRQISSLTRWAYC